MPKHTDKVRIYAPATRAERIFNVVVDWPDLIIDCLDRDTSCLDLQMLAEAAASSRTCRITIEVTVSKPKR
jgi:hypothetical protein